MNKKAYRVLEYNKIIEKLSAQAASSITKKMIEELKPSIDMYQIQEQLTETTEAVSVIMRKGPLPLGSFYDTKDMLYFAYKGGTLTMRQLLEILYNLQAARNAAGFLKSDLPLLPRMKGYAEVLFIDKHLEDEIDRCILSEDEMADSASAELKRIRRSILRQNDAIKSKMNSILNASENRTLLQDAIVTMRQGRYVIPVKQEHKSKFSGIVHDQSSTGATLFIEPQAIVNLNNELREMELAEKKEIQRILEEFSGRVGQIYEELLNNQKLLVQLDYIFAKGKLSVAQKAMEPKMNTQGFLKIKNGRHPLIDPKKVVPINIALGKDYDTLIITGPNTGGKTVTLKTVGLFILMAQSGLHVPASDGTELPILDQVFADIGDEQSIEQSLSTFSSHMNNIVQIVQESKENTLVLLDELGAGTDPTEGAALAISILESIYGKGAKTIATTHYTELKKYALSSYRVQNASMEFNVETLSPTYRLSIGVPGRSNAFEISKKLGLPDAVIDHARSLLEKGDIEFEEVITSIEKDKITAEEERDEAIALKLEMSRRKEALDLQEDRFKEKREKILQKAKEEAREMVREAKEFADQVQRELREMEKMQEPSERNRRQEQVRSKIRNAGERYKDRYEAPQNIRPVRPGELKLGDRVRVLSLDQKGNVLTLPDDRGDLQVQIGLLKITANIKQISKVQENVTKKEKQKARYGALYRSKAQSVSISINVIGKNLDDASMEVDKYLDDAYMAGLKEVTVIHGRGAGILRDGLAQLFRRHKHVEKYRKGEYNEGGEGVTVVTLR
ncbi:endonuclease MutS2 [Sinanaerobacter sp. ZZT-01]|uniref:endonuclease MutS2 n=1 Tax=Sinanaerobacter sp. ZZT-01 TaxID=3111540 RepID=UPI002D795655|nr:endonuclease MutS2 [Sinanaerobacter sp. ZZT-01]WRR93696.1 endonuclease MutS2 [Sinanaerobacter sp. ZZT-01]